MDPSSDEIDTKLGHILSLLQIPLDEIKSIILELGTLEVKETCLNKISKAYTCIEPFITQLDLTAMDFFNHETWVQWGNEPYDTLGFPKDPIIRNEFRQIMSLDCSLCQERMKKSISNDNPTVSN